MLWSAPMHRSTYLLIACLGFLGGVGVASFSHIDSRLVLAIGAFGLIAFVSPRRVIAVYGVVFIAASLGAWRMSVVASEPSALWDMAGTKPKVRMAGFVDGDFEATANGGRYTFHVVSIESAGGRVSLDDRVLVSGPDWIRPRLGQQLILEGKIQRPAVYEDFDYAAFLAKDGIHATLYYPTYGVPSSLGLSGAERLSLRVSSELARVRGSVAEHIALAVPQPMAGYLSGILVGAKGVVGSELKDIFARTGTSHILAISGYNITIIASVLMLVLAPLGRRYAFVLAVVSICGFVVLVGGSASVVRAAIMGILMLTARYIGRAQHMGTAIVVSAAVMVAFNPLILRRDVGFQLSFLAVLGIVYVEPLMRQTFERWLRWKPLASLVATTLSAQVLVMPLLLYIFGTLAVYTLPVNVLVLPFVPIAMALGLTTAVAGMLWPFLGLFVGQLAWLVSAYQLFVIKFFAGLPYAAFDMPISSTAMIALYVGLAAWLISLYRGRVQPHPTA